MSAPVATAPSGAPGHADDCQRSMGMHPQHQPGMPCHGLATPASGRPQANNQEMAFNCVFATEHYAASSLLLLVYTSHLYCSPLPVRDQLQTRASLNVYDYSAKLQALLQIKFSKRVLMRLWWLHDRAPVTRLFRPSWQLPPRTPNP